MSVKHMLPSHSLSSVILITAPLLISFAAREGSGTDQSTQRSEMLLQASKPISEPNIGGLASLYPGDEGIERDKRVLFVEDFETGTPEQIGARWGQIHRKENVTLRDDMHGNSPGSNSIHFKNNAHLYTHTQGVDTMYARFYVKFHEKTGYNHHFVHLVADRTPTPWPKGGAGETPPGDAKFSTGIEPTGRWGKFPPPGVWNF